MYIILQTVSPLYTILIASLLQVGPQVKVLSHTARENGLGTSLIERLFKHYKRTKQNSIKSHTTTLLTNYRSHPSILMLASSLFYECTLLSRSDSKTHPKAPYPILFACTSINSEVDSFCNLPAENHKEANILVQNMMEYIRHWPTEWSSAHKPTIGLLASTRQQVSGYIILLYSYQEGITYTCHLHLRSPCRLVYYAESSVRKWVIPKCYPAKWKY